MKKYVIVGAALLVALIALTMTACDDISNPTAGSNNSTEGLAYTLNNDGASYSVSGIGAATATDIVIADVYEDLPVTSIGMRAFSDCESLTSITIPDRATLPSLHPQNNYCTL